MNHIPTRIEISQKTIVFAVLFIIGLYLTYLIVDIVAMVFIAVLITAALNPLVTKLERHKIPRGLSILLVFIIFYGLIIGFLAALIPPLVAQSNVLLNQITISQELTDNFSLSNINLNHLQIVAQQFRSVPTILSAVSSAFSSIVVILTLSVVSFYMLMERQKLHKYLVWFFGRQEAEKKAEAFIDSFEHQVGGWVRGQFFLMFVVGLLTYIGLLILGVSYALPLAIIVGFLEILPNIGPTLAAIPAVIIAFLTISPTMALAVLALYIVIQQLENNIILPYAMKKNANVNPIVSIIVILIGFRLGGVVFAVLAIPMFLVVKTVISEWSHFKKLQ